MAIVSVKLLHKSSSTVGRDRVRSHKLTYQVKTNDPTDTSAMIVQSGYAGLPVQFVTAHPDDATCVATSLDSCDRLESDPNTWHLTYTFDNATKDYYSSDDGDPTAAEIALDWGVETTTRAVTKDRDDAPILNAAGDPFEPLEVEDNQMVLTIERPEASFDVTVAGAYNNAINSDTFYGAEPKTLRVRITAKRAFRNQISYFNVRYEFKYRPQGWQPKLLQQGLRQLIDDPDNPGEKLKVPCFVAADGGVYTSDPVTSPVPLDADGLQVPVADLPAAAVYTEVNVFDELDFNALGF